jgi:hypothetical protein
MPALGRSIRADGLSGRDNLNLQLQAARETIRAVWLKVAEGLQPKYSRTDVIGALRMLAGFIGMSGTPMRILILSDMPPVVAGVESGVGKTDRRTAVNGGGETWSRRAEV